MENNIIKPELIDAIEIARLIKDAWNSAYKGIIPDDYLWNMDVDKISKGWEKAIFENKDNIFAYKENNQILGIIRFGKVEDSIIKNTGEIFVLYVKPEEKRKGIGTKLFSFAKTHLIKDGYNKMIIWCLKGNKQGSNFYIKHRWRKNKRKRLYSRRNKSKRRRIYV